jgi:DNA repair exonuclease SbcCD ATPase subunit
MGNENTSNVTDPSQGDPLSNPQAQGANSTSQGEQRPPISIEALQQKITELERDNRNYRVQRKQQEEAAQAAEQQRLKEQGQFKQLAEQHAARVQELEPVAQSYTQLAELVSGQIESQIKDWPAELKAFDPGADAPIEQRLAWLEKSKPLLEKMQQQVRTQQPGNVPNPRPAGTNAGKDVDELRSRYRESGKYAF